MIYSTLSRTSAFFIALRSADDSRNYFQQEDSSGLPVGQPNWVDPAVASWLNTTAANITATYGVTIPSLAFVHIPVQAFLKFQNVGVDANQEPGINDDNPLSPQVCRTQNKTKTRYNRGLADHDFF